VTRLLGVDLGSVRIGLALGDAPDGPVRPLATIRRCPTPADDAEALRAVVEREGIEEVVLGLPLDFDGGEGRQALVTREWGVAIATTLGLPVVLRDERLTSDLAARRIGPMKRGRSGGPPTSTQRRAYRARLDREAAAIILRDEIDARSGRGT
jgi:putative Holliday junction resolvase